MVGSQIFISIGRKHTHTHTQLLGILAQNNKTESKLTNRKC